MPGESPTLMNPEVVSGDAPIIQNRERTFAPISLYVSDDNGFQGCTGKQFYARLFTAGKPPTFITGAIMRN